MFYVKDIDAFQVASPAAHMKIIDTLRIEPKTRQLEDHCFVQCYLRHNQKLNQIERAKSLNARQQCVAHLRIASRGQDVKQQPADRLVIESLVHGGKEATVYQIYLERRAYETIMSADEKYLRANIQKLRGYLHLRGMRYEQLLHLAYHMQERSYGYKEVIYHEGEQPDYVYLVERGEFHYCKAVSRVVDKSSSNRIKKTGREPNVNKARLPGVASQLQVGIVEGGKGQLLGEEELLSNSPRTFTARCMSTDNTLLLIPRPNYLAIIDSHFTQTRMEWIKGSNMKKIQMKGQLLHKLVQIKSGNWRHAQKSAIRSPGHDKPMLQSSLPISGLAEGKPRGVSVDGAQLPKIIRSQSSEIQQGVPDDSRLQSIGKTKKQVKAQYSMPSRYVASKQQATSSHIVSKYQKAKAYQAREQSFSLTAPGYPEKEPKKEKPKAVTALSSLPSIVSSVGNSRTSEHLQQVAKFSMARPIIELKNIKSKYAGLIDSNSLIRQKQEILNMKLGSKRSNQTELFGLPCELVSSNRRPACNSELPSKKECRQMRSAVHSKQFMQMLLTETLKKAGYSTDTGITASHQCVGDEQSNVLIGNDVGKMSNRVKLGKHQSMHQQARLLDDNEFDKCYFKQF